MTSSRLAVALIGVSVVLQCFILSGIRSNVAPLSERPRAVYDAPTGATVDVRDMPFIGSPDAEIAIVEFGDYECPFCARHAATTLEQLRERFISTGVVRYVYANNPLDMHPSARTLARVAICAGDQGRYWEVHDELFDKQPRTSDEVGGVVEALPLDIVELQTCLESAGAEKVIARDLRMADGLEIQGTPSFALGRQSREGFVDVVRLVRGAQSLATFEEEVERLLTP